MTIENPIYHIEEQLNPEQLEFKKKVLEDFTRYRSDFIDDLPPAILKPGDENYDKYKCRTVFFSTVTLAISMLVAKNIIQKTDEIKNFFHYVDNKDFSKPATKEDINKINDILDFIIRNLS